MGQVSVHVSCGLSLVIIVSQLLCTLYHHFVKCVMALSMHHHITSFVPIYIYCTENVSVGSYTV
jgi:hypothetical protein